MEKRKVFELAEQALKLYNSTRDGIRKFRDFSKNYKNLSLFVEYFKLMREF